MSTETFLFKLKADSKDLVDNMKKAKTETKGVGGEFGKSSRQGVGFQKALGGIASGATVAATAIAAATSALVAYASAQGRAMRETEALANMAGLTVDEFRKMSFVMGTVGISGEKFGDIMKDTQERIGDFLATGGGPFQDFADVMSYTTDETLALAKEFENLSGDQVLQQMVNRMEAAGKSSQQMSFALEGMASDTTRLIPLLRDAGAQSKALGEQFDAMDSPLTEEEREQFAALANNVDLAQASFVNFLNNAISPFLPAINAATSALADFFATRAMDMDLDRILDNPAVVDDIDSLAQLNKMLEMVQTKEAELGEKLEERHRGENLTRVANREYKSLNETISARIKLLEEERAKQEELDLSKNTGNLSTTTGVGDGTGADGIDLKNRLEDIKDRFKSETELLQEKYEEEKAILDKTVTDEAERNALKLELKNEYEDSLFEINQEKREREKEAYTEFLDKLTEAEEERNEEKKGFFDNEKWWSESATKSQLDDGMKLLSYLGNNSKKSHKIKQGLAVANAGMNTAEGITKALAEQNYVGATLTAATGAAQIAAILSSTPDGGGSTTAPPPPEPQPQDTFTDQQTTVTDISSGGQETVRMSLDFSDESVVVLGKKFKSLQEDGLI